MKKMLFTSNMNLHSLIVGTLFCKTFSGLTLDFVKHFCGGTLDSWVSHDPYDYF